MKAACVWSGALLVALAGQAFAQITVDGVRDPQYGRPKWVQNVPTGFGDNAGSGECDENDIGDPSSVATGIEMRIPLVAIGDPAGAIRLCVFVNGQGHDFVSNQLIQGLPAGTDNLGDPRNVDFNAHAANQFVTAGGDGFAAPVIDGTLDGNYPPSLGTQTNRTGFGDNDDGSGTTCNGSEIDGVRAVVRGSDLFVFITGNLASNFTKVEIFVDSVAGGFNRLDTSTFPDVDFAALQRMQDDGSGNGLTFDAGFSADYYFTWGCGGDPVTYYPNYADLNNGIGRYLGSNQVLNGGTLSGGDNPDGIEIAMNNANTGGVLGRCPPQGNRDTASGSEIDALYAYVDSAGPTNRLYLLLTGNLQSNYDKIDLFFDVQAGGQNTLRGDNVDIDFNGLNRMGGDGVDPGLTFDEGFEPDYWMACTTGGGPIQQYANAAVLRTDGPRRDFNGNSYDYGAYDGGDKNNGYDPVPFAGPRIDPQDGFTFDIFCNYGPRLAAESLLIDPFNPVGTPNLIAMTIDNSNTGGVTDADASGAICPTTGVEISIDLVELGWDGASPIRVAGFVNAGGHDFVSNQVMGGLPDGSANLGEPRVLNLAVVAGNQYVDVFDDLVECPGDCDDDGTCDDVEIACGGSQDANGNGIPDECEFTDCNNNGVPDDEDILDGTSNDCNKNDIPDECEDPFCSADLAAPFGLLNVFDFLAYQTAFSNLDPCADLAAPFQVWNVFDFLAYQTAFGNGLPDC